MPSIDTLMASPVVTATPDEPLRSAAERMRPGSVVVVHVLSAVSEPEAFEASRP